MLGKGGMHALEKTRERPNRANAEEEMEMAVQKATVYQADTIMLFIFCQKVQIGFL